MVVRPRLTFFLLTAIAVVTGLSSASDRPDVELSASYMPPQFVVANPELRERVRAHLARLSDGDTAGAFEMRGSTLRLSPGLAERLASEAQGTGSHLRERARARLERLFGQGIEADEPVFLREYLPGNIHFRHDNVPQWPLRNDGTFASGVAGTDINITPVWDRFDGDDSLVIAVLDAGLNFLHPALKGRWYENPGETGMTQPGDPCWTGTPADKRFNACDDDGNGFVDDWRGWDFVDNNNDPHDYHGHGTQVSALIAAPFDTSAGMTGMLPRVRILPVRVLSTSGAGSTAAIADGIRYAARMGAHAINFSIGIGSSSESQTLRNAFAVARDSGVIIAAAAGNSGVNLDPNPVQPGSYGFENVYMIASHGPSGSLSGFSNYGAATVDLAAPGQSIVTAGIPPPLFLLEEGFEGEVPANLSVFPENGFVVGLDNIEGFNSLQWSTGHNARASLTGLDLRERNGGLLTFRVFFQQGNSNDRLRVSVIPEGGQEVPLAIIAGADSVRHLVYSLGRVDGTRFELRFQTCIASNCSSIGSVASRVVRIDDIRIRHADETAETQEVYLVTGGTSMAAPWFAGYAGLMRIASKRSGVPLTREQVLAGTTPLPALEGRVITGGRLDVAKGLDSYLRTLPRIAMPEAQDSAWTAGTNVNYAFSVEDSGGTLEGYAFSPVSIPPGASLSGSGAFDWNSPPQPGDHVLRVRADKPPLVLRRMVTFSLVAPAPVVAAVSGIPSLLRVGNRSFLLPDHVLSGERDMIRIEVFGADGRVRERLQGPLYVPAGARSAEYRLQGIHGVGMRVWVNGIPLKSAR